MSINTTKVAPTHIHCIAIYSETQEYRQYKFYNFE